MSGSRPEVSREVIVSIVRIHVRGSGRRASTLAFPELLSIAEGRQAFLSRTDASRTTLSCRNGCFLRNNRLRSARVPNRDESRRMVPGNCPPMT
jgi:hypothetical protein